jgi:DNA polymerase-1
MKKLLIVDGNAYIHRAYHALPLLFTSNNEQINAVYGFVRFLFKIKNNFKPDFMVVCFDYPSKNFRHKIFEDYKKNRKSLDDALISQMSIAREAVVALNIAQVEIKGYEADDLIATIIHNNREKADVQTFVVTADKDILQLVEGRTVFVWNDSKSTMYDANMVEKKYGIKPKHLIDLFALMGDVIDNIPGISGIGEKTAAKLIKKFGSLENILQNINLINGNLKKLIKEGKDKAILSKELVKLNKQVPLDCSIEKFKVRSLDASNVVPFFEKYEFKNLLKKYKSQLHVTQIKPKTDDNYSRHHFLSMPFVVNFEIVNTLEKAAEVANIIKRSKIFAFKTINPISGFLNPKIIGISFYVESKTFYFPIGHTNLNMRQITFEQFKNIFSSLFYSHNIKKIGYDLKRERNIYKILGIEISNMYFDVMLASYCLNPTESHSMASISKKHLGFTVGDDDNYLRKGVKKNSFVDCSIDKNSKYASYIVSAIFAIYKIFDAKIRESKMDLLFFDIEMPLVEVLSEMEFSGVKVNSRFLYSFDEKVVSELSKTEDNVYKIADRKFNINSPKQLSFVMFEKFNFPIIKKNKTGYSTDEGVLNELSYHRFPVEILKYRELKKLKNTYIDPIIKYCTCYGNRVHTIFNQAVTNTGRLSSTEPNLQNIPVKSAYGREFRSVFIPEDNKIFICADYSQIDLRVLAHISGDEKLIDAFRKGDDIHSATAREVFGIPRDQFVSNDLRNAAKSINFGIVYGISPFGLAKQLGISLKKAKEYIDGYFERYSGVKLWMEQVIKKALKDGYTCTIIGRKRYIPELSSENARVRNAGKRIALNTPIQGSSADIIKIAMINIYSEIKLRGYRSLILLQVHDDLLFEVPIDEVEIMTSMIKNKMENSINLSDVSIDVKLKVGKNWGEMEKI